MAINNVILEKGKNKPLLITVAMDNPAGVFQVQAVLRRKFLPQVFKTMLRLMFW
jgi:metal-dependent HD superfamily phosphatase/phosphodiesterase